VAISVFFASVSRKPSYMLCRHWFIRVLFSYIQRENLLIVFHQSFHSAPCGLF
jgi:hypothetical protein